MSTESTRKPIHIQGRYGIIPPDGNVLVYRIAEIVSTKGYYITSGAFRTRELAEASARVLAERDGRCDGMDKF